MTAPLRIFHVVDSAQWAEGERFLLQMADNLPPEGFRMAVVLPEKGPLEDELRRRNIPREIIPLSPPGNPVPMMKLSRLFAEWKPDIVQGHGERAGVYARLAAGEAIRISTLHAAPAHRPLLSKGARLLADRLTARRSTAVVCTAEHLRKDFLRRCPDLWDRTHVIALGVDLGRFDYRHNAREAARAALKLNGRWTLLLAGRMTEKKGHALLLEALRHLKSVLPPFRLLLAGDGPLLEPLKKMVEEGGLGDNVMFLGEKHETPALLAAADVVVVPSEEEDSPYILLEALAMEKPVIASGVQGIPEILANGNEGFLVPPRSVDKLIEALLTVLWNKEEARVRAETGRRRVQAEYDLRKNLGKWEVLYRELSGDILIR